MKPEHFQEILEALEVPSVLRYPNRGGRFTGTTGLLVLLARLGSAGTLVGLGRKLRMNPDRISKISITMVRWLRQRWSATLACGLDISRLLEYVDAILARTGVDLPVFGFIDVTLRGCRRVKYGQAAIYSGHKKKHGMKYQIVAVPDGLICCLAGPVQGRRGDSRILEESELEEYVLGIQRRTGIKYLIYADAAYAETETVATGYNKVQRRMDAAKDEYSRAMNGPRTSVEWAFGLVQQLFPWVDDVAANNVSVTPVGLFYQAAVLLTNCITCAQGQASVFYSYFELPPPSLASYLSA